MQIELAAACCSSSRCCWDAPNGNGAIDCVHHMRLQTLSWVICATTTARALPAWGTPLQQRTTGDFRHRLQGSCDCRDTCWTQVMESACGTARRASSGSCLQCLMSKSMFAGCSSVPGAFDSFCSGEAVHHYENTELGFCEGPGGTGDSVNGKRRNGILDQEHCQSFCDEQRACTGYSYGPSEGWCDVFGPGIDATAVAPWTGHPHATTTIAGANGDAAMLCVIVGSDDNGPAPPMHASHQYAVARAGNCVGARGNEDYVNMRYANAVRTQVLCQVSGFHNMRW